MYICIAPLATATNENATSAVGRATAKIRSDFPRRYEKPIAFCAAWTAAWRACLWRYRKLNLSRVGRRWRFGWVSEGKRGSSRVSRGRKRERKGSRERKRREGVARGHHRPSPDVLLRRRTNDSTSCAALALSLSSPSTRCSARQLCSSREEKEEPVSGEGEGRARTGGGNEARAPPQESERRRRRFCSSSFSFCSALLSCTTPASVLRPFRESASRCSRRARQKERSCSLGAEGGQRVSVAIGGWGDGAKQGREASFPLTWTAFRGSAEIFGSENEAPESIFVWRARARGRKRRSGEKRAHEAKAREKEEESTL